MALQPIGGSFVGPARDNFPAMYRTFNCSEVQGGMRPQFANEMAQSELLPANVAKGVIVDVIVFCDGNPQMRCKAKLGSKAFTHSVSTWYLYAVPTMLRKALRKLQQSRWGYGFEVLKDPATGDVNVVHLTYQTKPSSAIKEEPATLRLKTYTNPDDGASAVIEYARDFKANRKRKLCMTSGGKAMPSGTRIRLTAGTLQYTEPFDSSPLPSQSGSPTSPYGTQSPSISSDCTQATDRLNLPAMPRQNMVGSSNAAPPDAGWEVKDESLMTSTAMATSNLMHTSAAMHTTSLTEPHDTSRGHMSVNCSAQPTPSSMAQYDDGYASQASSHTTPAPSPLTLSNQQTVQIHGVRNDNHQYMPPPQSTLLGGGRHRLFGGVYEHVSSNSSNSALPKSADTAASPGSAECSDDDVDPGLYCNGSFANSSFGNTATAAGTTNTNATGNGMASNLSASLSGPAPANGPRKLQAGSTVFNFKPQGNTKSYDQDATVHSMYLPKEPNVMPSCASRLPNLRPVHLPLTLPVMSAATTSLDGWHSQAAASATPTPNSGMALPSQLPNLFDVSSSAPDGFDNMGNFARSQCQGQLPPLPDLWDWNARLAMASPGTMAGPLSAAQLHMWGDDAFTNDCGVRSDNFQPNMDLDSLLNTSNWGQTNSAVL